MPMIVSSSIDDSFCFAFCLRFGFVSYMRKKIDIYNDVCARTHYDKPACLSLSNDALSKLKKKIYIFANRHITAAASL